MIKKFLFNMYQSTMKEITNLVVISVFGLPKILILPVMFIISTMDAVVIEIGIIIFDMVMAMSLTMRIRGSFVYWS